MHIIKNATSMPNYVVRVEFDDGTIKIVDLSHYIRIGRAFHPLKDKKLFDNIHFDKNSVYWNHVSNHDIDLSSDTLYYS